MQWPLFETIFAAVLRGGARVMAQYTPESVVMVALHPLLEKRELSAALSPQFGTVLLEPGIEDAHFCGTFSPAAACRANDFFTVCI